MYNEYKKQALSPDKVLRWLAVAAVPSFLFYAISIAVMRSMDFEIMEILRDPAQQTGQSSFLGFVSNIGIWLWISSAAIAFFHVVSRSPRVARNRRELLLLVGMLSLLLAIDDFFMIHDRYVNQKICYLAYAVLLTLLLLRHHEGIFAIDGFAFLAAGSMLATSIVLDLGQRFIPVSYEDLQIVEEGFKFTGAATWLYFCCRVAQYDISEATPRLRDEQGATVASLKAD